ncbi:MAG: prepilin peptidase [Actinobacteria bacterium]|nr:prepilin peptidase [Actinomycetota bacterium]
MSSIFYYLIFIISGLIIGSFLNVLIYRLPENISIVKSSSFCPVCHSKIKFYDNIPLLSYIILKGRCRNCKTKIKIRYPLVEALTSFFYAISYYFLGISFNLLLSLILISGLITISFIDIEHGLIPNVIVLPLTVTGLLINILLMPKKWWIVLAFSFGAFLFMLIISLIYPKGMGMGDVKLSLMAGSFLIQKIVPGLFIGFLAGSIFGLIMILIKKRKIKQTIPFGPFISLGCIVALFFGDKIINWYLGYL